jgi:hypothetical protein
MIRRIQWLTWDDGAGLIGQDHGLHSVAESELGQQVAHVCLDRRLADEQGARDLGVAAAPGQQHQDLPLAHRQRGQP